MRTLLNFAPRKSDLERQVSYQSKPHLLSLLYRVVNLSQRNYEEFNIHDADTLEDVIRGIPCSEIAKRTGYSYENVRIRINNALNRLEHTIEHWENLVDTFESQKEEIEFLKAENVRLSKAFLTRYNKPVGEISDLLNRDIAECPLLPKIIYRLYQNNIRRVADLVSLTEREFYVRTGIKYSEGAQIVRMMKQMGLHFGMELE